MHNLFEPHRIALKCILIQNKSRGPCSVHGVEEGGMFLNAYQGCSCGYMPCLTAETPTTKTTPTTISKHWPVLTAPHSLIRRQHSCTVTEHQVDKQQSLTHSQCHFFCPIYFAGLLPQL